MFSTNDLPTALGADRVTFRPSLSRIVEHGFRITDDYFREARDSHDGRFRPVDVNTRLNLDTGRYEVAMSGPAYGSQAASYGTYAGDDFLDCDEHRHSLVIVAVTECLRAHNLIKES